MERTGCEWLECPFYIDGKCTETLDCVNKDTGEDMCSRNPNAIPREEWFANQSIQSDG